MIENKELKFIFKGEQISLTKWETVGFGSARQYFNNVTEQIVVYTMANNKFKVYSYGPKFESIIEIYNKYCHQDMETLEEMQSHIDKFIVKITSLETFI
jgi:hypothetical protein